MFIVLLKFADNKAKAGELMDGHNAWLARGFDDGVFLLAGSLAGGQGGPSSRTARRAPSSNVASPRIRSSPGASSAPSSSRSRRPGPTRASAFCSTERLAGARQRRAPALAGLHR